MTLTAHGKPLKMRKPVNHLGKTFNSWTVIESAPKSSYGRAMWKCRCVCGTESVVAACHLVNGASSRCRACYAKSVTGDGSVAFKHGHRKGGIYSIWCNMIQRCENPNSRGFADYGARGIYVCDRWRNDYRTFVEDMGPRPSPDHEIDRRDNDKGYSPENCRWATRSTNMRNTRRAILVEYKGERMPLATACELSGLNYHSVKWSIYRGRSHKGISP